MSNDQRKPILRVTYRKDKQTYSVCSVWKGKFPGTYDLSRDKGTEKYPAIGFLDALKAWATGDGYVSISVESERERRDGGRQQGGFDGNEDDTGDSIPF